MKSSQSQDGLGVGSQPNKLDVSFNAVHQLGDGGIQQDKLFHVIVTYGCIPKTSDEAENQRDGDENAMV